MTTTPDLAAEFVDRWKAEVDALADLFEAAPASPATSS